MIINRDNIYFEKKLLKDIPVSGVFSYNIDGELYTRVIINQDYNSFFVMSLSKNICIELQPEELEKFVYVFQAVVTISRIEKK